MNKDMNKLLLRLMKYDLISGLLISLVIGLSFSFSYALIYFIGLSIGLLNFYSNSLITSRMLGKKGGSSITILVVFFRIILIGILIIPFIGDILKVSFYIAGFIFNYLVLIICALKK